MHKGAHKNLQCEIGHLSSGVGTGTGAGKKRASYGAIPPIYFLFLCLSAPEKTGVAAGGDAYLARESGYGRGRVLRHGGAFNQCKPFAKLPIRLPTIFGSISTKKGLLLRCNKCGSKKRGKVAFPQL